MARTFNSLASNNEKKKREWVDSWKKQQLTDQLNWR